MRELPETDEEWDAAYGAGLTAAAGWHFTDLASAHRASDYLAGGVAGTGERACVDLGSGAGKFVLAAAARHPARVWHGVEARPRLVAEAEAWRARYGVPNARFEAGDLLEVNFADYAGAYLFNPFGELLDARPDLGGGLRARGREGFRAGVGALRQNLSRAPEGFRLVTYYCEEGQVPEGYVRVWAEEKLVGWRRVPRSADRGTLTPHAPK